MKRSLEETV
jgi:hypothetical protein